MAAAPIAAITTNHTTMTGPNILPIRSGAVALEDEQSDQDGEGERRMRCFRLSLSTPRPSTAESTEIAGVSMPSP